MEESIVTHASRTSIDYLGLPIFMPFVGLDFNFIKDAQDFYNLYSWEIGFGSRRGRSRTNNNKYRTR